MKLLFATNNKAKINHYSKHLVNSKHQILSLIDIGLETIEVNEDGETPLDNAYIKANTFHQLSGLTTFAMDDGLYFEGVPTEIQPGIHVRRINNKRLNDQEMIEYYTNIVNQYGNNEILNGYFLKGIVLMAQNKRYDLEIKTDIQFTNKVSNKIDEGYPLASIQYKKEFNKFKSELTQTEDEQLRKEENERIFYFINQIISQIEV